MAGVVFVACLMLAARWAGAEGEAPPDALEEAKKAQQAVADLKIALDTVWVMVTAFLVFFMNLGFGMIESGLARVKNTVNILAKNFIVFAIATIGFLVLGWGLMFGNGNALRVRLHCDGGEVLKILGRSGNLYPWPDVLPATPT